MKSRFVSPPSHTRKAPPYVRNDGTKVKAYVLDFSTEWMRVTVRVLVLANGFVPFCLSTSPFCVRPICNGKPQKKRILQALGGPQGSDTTFFLPPLTLP